MLVIWKHVPDYNGNMVKVSFYVEFLVFSPF